MSILLLSDGVLMSEITFKTNKQTTKKPIQIVYGKIEGNWFRTVCITKMCFLFVTAQDWLFFQNLRTFFWYTIIVYACYIKIDNVCMFLQWHQKAFRPLGENSSGWTELFIAFWHNIPKGQSERELYACMEKKREI